MNYANKTKINELMSKWVNYGLIILTIKKYAKNSKSLTYVFIKR